MQDIERRVERLEDCYDRIAQDVASIKGSTGTVEMILKWVVLPLLVIVGGLVGIKIALP